MAKFSKIVNGKLLVYHLNGCYNTEILFALHINLQYKLNRQWIFQEAGPAKAAADE